MTVENPEANNNAGDPAQTTNVQEPEKAADTNTENKGSTVVTGKDGAANKPTEVAPESYQDFTLSEGFTADVEVTGEFKTLAKELNLSQEKAQKLVDLQNKLFSKTTAEMSKRFDTIQNEWVNAAKNDPEYGGKDFDKNLGLAKKALDQFGNPALNKIIEQTGMGNNPEFIRLLVKVGKTISEDGVMTNGNSTAKETDPAKVLFPNMA